MCASDIQDKLMELPKNFDAFSYINFYNDLKMATNNLNEEQKIKWAKEHYLNYGKSEGRVFFSKPTEIDYISFSKDKLKYKYSSDSCVKKTVYIHIGYGKTGTTSIQNMLRNNQNLLKDNGILFPLNYDSYSISRIGALDVTSEETIRGISVIYPKLIYELENTYHDKLIISSETFISINNLYINFIKELFSDYNVKIIFYIRRQIDLIQSVFLHENKAWTYYRKSAYDLFCIERDSAFNFETIIEPWVRTFGQSSIQASLYHSSICGEDVRIHFLKKILGENSQILNELSLLKERSNQSLHPIFSRLAVFLNKESSLMNRPKILNELLSLSQKLKHIKHSLFTPEQEEEIKQYYAASNAAFADKYLTPREKELLLS